MESEVIKTFSKEEETAVKRLQEIHVQISDGIVELQEIQAKLPTFYEQRKKIEIEAIEDALAEAKNLSEQIGEYYSSIIAFGRQVNDTFAKVKKLGDVIQVACDQYEMKSDQIVSTYSKFLEEQTRMKEFIKEEHKKLDARSSGLDAFNANIIKRAAEVQSRIDALTAIKS